MNLEVEQGSTYCIIGRSGAGKSVTLKHIIGLLKPDRGEIFIDGKDVTGVSDRKYDVYRRRMGVLFQSGALINWLTVGENVALPLREHERLREKEIQRRVQEKLELVELHGCENQLPDSISGGMKKRVGLARAMVRNPELLLYDEPTSGLDPVMSNQINELILSMQQKTRVTSIVVTHDMSAAYMIGDRIGMFYQGEIIEEGTPDEIRRTANSITRQFIEGRTRGPITTEEDAFVGHDGEEPAGDDSRSSEPSDDFVPEESSGEGEA
ncbi:MAG: ATP-binding cassette domain-containing protein [Planctomycetes bacterium]|nr:ATP-binding cassette domain-containing protein [Planctomycetota bacterium]